MIVCVYKHQEMLPPGQWSAGPCLRDGKRVGKGETGLEREREGKGETGLGEREGKGETGLEKEREGKGETQG